MTVSSAGATRSVEIESIVAVIATGDDFAVGLVAVNGASGG